MIQEIVPENGAVEGAEELVEQPTLSIIDLFLEGGIIMWVLLAMSIYAVYIFVERYMALSRALHNDNTFMDKIRDYIHGGNIDSARQLCEVTESPVARLVGKGISRIGRPLADVQTAVENAGNIEVNTLEKGLANLASISGGAPMIGFLGTVTGMIQAFFQMASAGNNIEVSSLAGGIYTALVTTVGGLVVGILAYFMYNYLTARVDRVVATLEARTMDFMDMLNEPAA
ncbi:MAG: MotA/TolQ/ExbB proton channel family protein [Bacteroidales bacterium]|jgi:biopolymer transport protein ExbB|nr:MotA/TolQ/ExbB proton channel family protein [Bacteroidales bacterium]